MPKRAPTPASESIKAPGVASKRRRAEAVQNEPLGGFDVNVPSDQPELDADNGGEGGASHPAPSVNNQREGQLVGQPLTTRKGYNFFLALMGGKDVKIASHNSLAIQNNAISHAVHYLGVKEMRRMNDLEREKLDIMRGRKAETTAAKGKSTAVKENKKPVIKPDEGSEDFMILD